MKTKEERHVKEDMGRKRRMCEAMLGECMRVECRVKDCEKTSVFPKLPAKYSSTPC